jgi:hypothetical protein
VEEGVGIKNSTKSWVALVAFESEVMVMVVGEVVVVFAR